MKKQERIRKKWITPAILKLINKKNNLYIQTKKEPNNEIIKNEYIHLKKEIEISVNNSKKAHLQKIIDTSQCESKAVWDCMKNICGSGLKSETEIKEIIFDGVGTLDNKE